LKSFVITQSSAIVKISCPSSVARVYCDKTATLAS